MTFTPGQSPCLHWRTFRAGDAVATPPPGRARSALSAATPSDQTRRRPGHPARDADRPLGGSRRRRGGLGRRRWTTGVGARWPTEPRLTPFPQCGRRQTADDGPALGDFRGESHPERRPHPRGRRRRVRRRPAEHVRDGSAFRVAFFSVFCVTGGFSVATRPPPAARRRRARPARRRRACARGRRHARARPRAGARRRSWHGWFSMHTASNRAGLLATALARLPRRFEAGGGGGGCMCGSGLVSRHHGGLAARRTARRARAFLDVLGP